MKKVLCLIALVGCIFNTACGDAKSIGIIGGADGPTAVLISEEEGEKNMYKQISQEHAKKIMDSDGEYIILDVREQSEYDEGHIPGAMVIPYEQISEKAEGILTDKDKQILVYCRSGRRSKIAAEALAKLGYKNVMEFGGIIDWPFEIEK